MAEQFFTLLYDIEIYNSRKARTKTIMHARENALYSDKTRFFSPIRARVPIVSMLSINQSINQSIRFIIVITMGLGCPNCPSQRLMYETYDKKKCIKIR